MKIYYLLILASLAFLNGISHRAQAAVLAVDWGGNYGSTARSQSTVGATLSTGDYDFGGTSNDRARILAYGTNFTPNSMWSVPENKTGNLTTAAQVANLNSATDPGFTNYRINATNTLQVGSTTTGATANMRLSGAFYATKGNFLNGLNAIPNLSFSDETAGASLIAGWTAGSTAGVRQTYFLVQNSSSWYVTLANSATTLTATSINPYTSTWYSYDPSSNEFLDVSNLGTGVLGSTFNDIQAFGVYGQNTLYNGTTTGALMSVSGFSLALVPEPGSFALLGLAFLMLTGWCKRRRSAQIRV